MPKRRRGKISWKKKREKEKLYQEEMESMKSAKSEVKPKLTRAEIVAHQEQMAAQGMSSMRLLYRTTVFSSHFGIGKDVIKRLTYRTVAVPL